MKKVLIIIYALISCGILYFVEQSVGVSYLFKSSLKLVLFVVLPMFYLKKNKSQGDVKKFKLDRSCLSNLKHAFIFGILGALLIIILGIVFSPTIDFVSLRLELAEKLKVTKSVFIFVALYITFINSFIEEFFFRGIVYLGLDSEGKRLVGSLFSGILFGLYHMAMFASWFSPLLVFICVLGLSLVGVFFNYINTRTKSFLNSWIIHIIADTSIMAFGYFMLYIK
jgi:membrane protease YdiL (CAAX protease family)